MKIPLITKKVLIDASTLDRRAHFEQTLMRRDRRLFAHCEEIIARSQDPLLASKAFGLAFVTLNLRCTQAGIAIPVADDSFYRDLTHEMLALGIEWDPEVEKRMRAEQRDFHTVFSTWSSQTPKPPVARFGTATMYRTFELLLQPL